MNVVALPPNGAPVDWETIPFAAIRSGRHAVTIRRALQSGELHGHQRVFGGRWLIHPSALDAWVRGDPDTMTPCGCRPVRTRRGA